MRAAVTGECRVAILKILFSIGVIALLSACTQPGQSSLPRFAASKTKRAQLIYFSGIQLSEAGPGGFLGPGELGVYPATANGNLEPTHVIVGKNTGLFEDGGYCVPQAAFFDPADSSIWTCRTFSNFIDRFSTGRGRSS